MSYLAPFSRIPKMPEYCIYTLDYLLAGFMSNNLSGIGVEIIYISPMGCRLGFCVFLINAPEEQRVADVLKVKRQLSNS